MAMELLDQLKSLGDDPNASTYDKAPPDDSEGIARLRANGAVDRLKSAVLNERDMSVVDATARSTAEQHQADMDRWEKEVSYRQNLIDEQPALGSQPIELMQGNLIYAQQQLEMSKTLRDQARGLQQDQLSDFSAGFSHGMLGLAKNLGFALKQYGEAADSEAAAGIGAGVAELAGQSEQQDIPAGMGMRDIHGVGGFGRYAAQTAGGIAPYLAAGLVGGEVPMAAAFIAAGHGQMREALEGAGITDKASLAKGTFTYGTLLGALQLAVPWATMRGLSKPAAEAFTGTIADISARVAAGTLQMSVAQSLAMGLTKWAELYGITDTSGKPMDWSKLANELPEAMGQGLLAGAMFGGVGEAGKAIGGGYKLGKAGEAPDGKPGDGNGSDGALPGSDGAGPAGAGTDPTLQAPPERVAPSGPVEVPQEAIAQTKSDLEQYLVQQDHPVPLAQDEVQQIAADVAKGMSVPEAAAKFGHEEAATQIKDHLETEGADFKIPDEGLRDIASRMAKGAPVDEAITSYAKDQYAAEAKKHETGAEPTAAAGGTAAADVAAESVVGGAASERGNQPAELGGQRVDAAGQAVPAESGQNPPVAGAESGRQAGARQPTITPAHTAAFRDLLHGPTPRKQWAEKLGVDPGQLAELIAQGKADGLLRVDRNGVVRRTAGARTGEGVASEMPAELPPAPAAAKPANPTAEIRQAAALPARAELDAAMKKDFAATRRQLKAADNEDAIFALDWLERATQRLAAEIDAGGQHIAAIVPAVQRAAAALENLAPGSVSQLSTQHIKTAAAKLKAARAAAPTALPSRIEGQDVALTPKAVAKIAELQAAVDKAVAGILPRDVRTEVVQNIALARAGREDEIHALRTAQVATQTPAFKNWFGDSKVVDEQDNPKIVYHGTVRGDFQEFDVYGAKYGLMGQGGYFTEASAIASEYAGKNLLHARRAGTEAQTVYAVYLKIKNPIDMEAKPDIAAWTKAYDDHVYARDFDGVKTNEDAYRVVEEALSAEDMPSADGAEVMQDGLRSMGYDGITHIGGGRVDPNGPRHRVWIAFDPEQIKSAFNRGTFDPNDPRISYSLRSTEDTLHSSESDTVPADTGGTSDEQLSRTGESAGSARGTADQSDGSQSSNADRAIGAAAGADPSEARILRQESATLRADGSPRPGRLGDKARGAKAGSRDAEALQPIGTTEQFDAAGHAGLVTAANVRPHAELDKIGAPESEKRLVTLTYRLYPEGTELANAKRDVLKQLGKPEVWARVSQHLDGSWEVSNVEVGEGAGRRGLATKLYNAIEKDLGIRMSPSGLLTKEGLSYWQKRSPESVKWHQYSKHEGHYVSPVRVKNRLDEIGKDIAAIHARPEKDSERVTDLAGAIAERKELVKLWLGLPPEARAAAKANEMFALRGFFSPAIRAAEQIKQEKGTGEQFWKQIAKIPGVKKDELDWMGLEEFLKDKKSVTKAEVLDFMRAHQVQLDEKSFGGKPAEVTEEVISSASQAHKLGLEIEAEDLAGLDEAIAVKAKKATVLISKEKGTSFYTVHDPFSDRTLSASSRDQAKHMAYGLLQENVTDTRFGAHKVPGGENYRELLIRLPEFATSIDPAGQKRMTAIQSRIDELVQSDFLTGRETVKSGFEDEVQKLRAEYNDLTLKGGETPRYQSKHFQDQELVHLRVDDRTRPNGEKVLFGNEIQSDLHQGGRKYGYQGKENKELISKLEKQLKEEEQKRLDALKPYMDKDGLVSAEITMKPEINAGVERVNRELANAESATVAAPFKGDLWLELALKRMLQYAVEHDYDAISWARSDQIAKAVGAEPAKLALQYDQKIGKFLDKYTKKWGGKVEEASFIEDVDALPEVNKFSSSTGKNQILRITPEMRASIAEGQPLFSARPQHAGVEALGKTDPTAQLISIGARAVENEAARTGKAPETIAAQTARHEALEFFKDKGIIAPKEWETLLSTARAEGWVDETGVREAYSRLNKERMSPAELESLIEKEAIMEKYGQYEKGDYTPTGVIAKVFKRIKEFLDRLKNAIKGEGFHTWEDIFQKVDTGELKRRYDAIYGDHAFESTAPTGQPHLTTDQLLAARAAPPPRPAIEDTFAELRAELGLQMPFAKKGETPTLRQQMIAIASAGDQVMALHGPKLAPFFDLHGETLSSFALPLSTNRAQEGFSRFFREFVLRPNDLRQRHADVYNDFADGLDAEAPHFLEALDRLQEQGRARLADIQAQRAVREAAAAAGGGKKPPAPPSGPTIGAVPIPKAFNNMANFWKRNFQPELVSAKALEADALFAAYKAGTAQEKDMIFHRADQWVRQWNQVSEEQQFQFLRDVDTGTPQPNAELAEYAWRLKQLLDQAYRDEAVYGSKAGYTEEYLPREYENPEEVSKFFATKAATSGLGPKWFQKKRHFELLEEARAAGFKLKSTNPEEIVANRLMAGADMRQRMELLRGLEKMGLARRVEDLEAQGVAQPGVVKIGANGGPELDSNDGFARMGWEAINAPNMETWLISPDIQPLWKNAVAAKGLWNNEGMPGSVFRKWMAFKNVWVPIKLAMSGFHPMHVMGINIANNLARAYTQAVRGGDYMGAARSAATAFDMRQGVGLEARHAWLKPREDRTGAENALVDLMVEGGFVPQLSEQLRINAQKSFQKAIDQGGIMGWAKAMPTGMRRGMEKIQAPIFERWIPGLKAAAYIKEARALFERRPDLLDDGVQRRVALRAIGKQVDDRFGEMFYGNLFWNRAMKDGAIGTFLSLGWQTGLSRQFGGAALEIPTRLFYQGPKPRQTVRDATNKQANAILYIMTSSMFLGGLGWALSGRFPQSWVDWIFPPSGEKNPDGTEHRLNQMSYTREVPMLMKHIQEEGGGIGGTVNGAAEMLKNKLMIQPFVEMLENRDYWGYEIYDSNAWFPRKAVQFGKHMVLDQLSPITLSGANRAATISGHSFPSLDKAITAPGQFASEFGSAMTQKSVALAFAGFGPAPAYAERTALENRIRKLYNTFVSPQKKPYAAEDADTAKREAKDELRMALQRGDATAAAEARKKARDAGANSKGLTQSRLAQPASTYLFSRLPPEIQRSILQDASPEETQLYRKFANTKIKKEFPAQIVLGPRRALEPAQ